MFYTYTNGHGWGSKEDISGQSCANADNFNDRKMTITGDTTIAAKFADCSATYSDSVYVEFYLDMGDETVSDAGLWLAGGNYFGHPNQQRYHSLGFQRQVIYGFLLIAFQQTCVMLIHT